MRAIRERMVGANPGEGNEMLHVQFLPFEKARSDWGVAKENVQLSNPNKALVLEFLAV